MRPLLASTLAGLVLWAAFVAQAFAHAEPVRARPGDGAVLARPPAQVELTMTQDMARQPDANDIEVLDATGQKVTRTSAVIDNADRRKLSVALPSDLAVGTYTVNWKTLSADDGDNASGSLTFTYDPSKPPAAGREELGEAPAGPDGPEAPAAPVSLTGPSDGGTSWVLVVAVAVGMFVAGSGATFLVIQKKP